ncbi:MAG: PhzF family phenazine biosynthesis isomerase [Pseudomonadota bacterium]
MDIQKLASFSDGSDGGNPAGVVVSDTLPADADMQAMAAEVGFSETAFAAPHESGWRVRYFSPESEVPFCGHATIALGAALARMHGPDVYPLKLNDADITVEGFVDGEVYSAALQSPKTTSAPADAGLIEKALSLFGFKQEDLDPRLPPARANAGAEHLIIGLRSRELLAAMHYELDAGRQFMRDAGLVTVMFVYSESAGVFHSRNPFASGGVYEDPATGAASAAFAGYLRDLDWPHAGEIDIIQGEDMGSRSLINARFSGEAGASIRLTGAVRLMD